MTRYYKLIVLFASSLLIFGYTCRAQAADSLMYYLGRINNATDTNDIKEVFTHLANTSEEVLLKEDVLNAIEKLKTSVEEIDYYDLVSAYFNRLIDINTTLANEKALQQGQNWVSRNDDPRSKYGRHSYLAVLRDLRIPFRNSGKLAEAVEYFSEMEKKFLAANDSAGVSVTTNALSGFYFRLGMIERGDYYQLKSIAFLNDKQEDYTLHSNALLFGISGKLNRYAVLGGYYVEENKPAIAVGYLKEAIRYYHQLDSPLLMRDVPFLFLQMASCKTLEKSDSTSYFYDKALELLRIYNSDPIEYAGYYQEKAADFISRGLLDSAMESINRSEQLKDSFNLPVSSYFGELLPAYYKATILLKKGRAQDAIALLKIEIDQVRQLNLKKMLIKELVLLADAYIAAGNTGEGYKTLAEAFTLKEEIVKSENEARSLGYETEKKIQETEKTILLLDAKNKSNKKIKYYLVGIISLLGVLATGLGVFYRNKRKSNRELSLKNERLAYTLDKLQATQSQLVQAEKMASLGELTAGIAHEIQNPLNFVNNFSEVSTELLDEMNEELAKGNTKAAAVIAADVKQNLEKVLHHGKRADGIVKGMLQHSRSNSGVKELTDINALCDEYVRLAYHGLRARDKSFNANFTTDLDENVVAIHIVPQDIGRVVLNLINNAFYAVNERKIMNETGFEPTVMVSTKKTGSRIEISVKDNGTGIPQAVIDKIFQPFFTTKPTGLGTGLGLSLSYDIVTKGHGGELRVETREGEGTEFIIGLPIA